MRGLWSILAQSFSLVSKSGSIFSQFGSGFTEKACFSMWKCALFSAGWGTNAAQTPSCSLLRVG